MSVMVVVAVARKVVWMSEWVGGRWGWWRGCGRVKMGVLHNMVNKFDGIIGDCCI